MASRHRAAIHSELLFGHFPIGTNSVRTGVYPPSQLRRSLQCIVQFLIIIRSLILVLNVDSHAVLLLL